ncbi:hypothetical protein L3V83_04700 [Thiotrichales bacterium 19X7-9]|nr:hypothetical protein [Thiotrichales bacterium 19X7-9]
MDDNEVLNFLESVHDQYLDYPELHNILTYIFCGRIPNDNFNVSSDKELKSLCDTLKNLFISDKTQIKKLINSTNNPNLNSIKNIIEEILKYINDSKTKYTILKYLSGLSLFKFHCLTEGYNERDIHFSLSQEPDYLIKVSTEKNISYSVVIDPISTFNSITIKPIHFCNMRMLTITPSCRHSMKFLRLKLHSYELIPNKSKNHFVISSLRTVEAKHEVVVSSISEKENDNYTDCKLILSNSSKSHITCLNLFSLALECIQIKTNLKFTNCTFSSIKWKNCNFNKIPYFDNQCRVNQFVDIDPPSIKSLAGEPLEYSNLTSFFSKNGAYLEAQQLHQKFLLAKANRSNIDKQFKYLVKLYDEINSCGTNILKPIRWWLFIYIINVLLVFLSFNFWCSVKQVTLILIPALTIIEKTRISLLPWYTQLCLYISMILSYILLFLIALTIRKKLKLRE